MRRNEREDMVCDILSLIGFTRNLRDFDGAVTAYEEAYNLGFVRAGEAGKAGRATTLIDAVRPAPSGGFHFVAVKGHKIGSDGKLPDGADLVTGSRWTIQAVIAAARRGVPLPVVHFASTDDQPTSGYVLIYDAAEIVRAADNLDARPNAPGHRWGRGNAPAARVGMTPGIPSGGKYVRHEIGWSSADDWTYATAPNKVAYPQLQVGYHAANLKGAWTQATIEEIPGMVEAFLDGGW